ncbi:MAG: hypothetical protein IJ867_06160 [Clostridia bacterium]|nr:hypothetical protein [Clostridia bacterium]
MVVLKNRKNDIVVETKATESSIEIKNDYDEETGLYYIIDEVTGEIIYASQDENDPNFDFYREHPDYNPNPLEPRSTRLDDFWGYGDVVDENSNIE